MLANGVTVPLQPMCGDLWNTDPPKPRGHLCDHYHNHIKAAGDYHRGLRGETLSVRRVGYEPCLQGAPIIGGGGGFLCKRGNTKNIPSLLKKKRKKERPLLFFWMYSHFSHHSCHQPKHQHHLWADSEDPTDFPTPLKVSARLAFPIKKKKCSLRLKTSPINPNYPEQHWN